MKNPRLGSLLGIILALVFGLTPVMTLAEDRGGEAGQLKAGVDTNLDASLNTEAGSATVHGDSESKLNANTEINIQQQGQEGEYQEATTTDRESKRSNGKNQREKKDTTDRMNNEQGDQNDGEIDISRDSIDAEATSTGGTEIDSADSVHTKADLKLFANHKLKSDKDADEIKVSSTTVETLYPTRARLFGFIPVSLQSRVVVNGDGTVSVTFPWYAFLFGTNQGKLQSDLSQSVKAAVGSGTASTTLSAGLQARLLDSVLSRLHADFSGSN